MPGKNQQKIELDKVMEASGDQGHIEIQENKGWAIGATFVLGKA